MLIIEFILVFVVVLIFLIGIACNYYIFRQPLKEAVRETLISGFRGAGLGLVARADYLSIVIGITLLILSLVLLDNYTCHPSACHPSLIKIINALIAGLIAGIVFIL